MTERPNASETHDLDADVRELETTDPADAPQLAEDLADRLANELDGSAGTDASGRRDPS